MMLFYLPSELLFPNISTTQNENLTLDRIKRYTEENAMCEKSPDKTTKDTLEWPFYPRYLTQILPEDVLTLLLAGIVERLKAPLLCGKKGMT
jgi:hypothetical protein